MQRGVDTLTAEEIVRLADLLKPRGRPVATLSALLDELEASSRQMIAGLLPPGDPMRRSRLHALRFIPEEVPLARLRPWPGMGGLPCRWTDSADVVQLASRIRRQGVPRQADRLEQMLLWSQAYPGEAAIWLRRLPAIAIPEFHSRLSLTHAPLTLDDGSHRALVLALLDHESVPCWVGY